MLRFSLFGIPVIVQPWFWITMGLLGAMMNGDNTVSAVLGIALFIIAGFLSVLVHELGHGLTAKAFGRQPIIVLQAFGGYAAYQGGKTTRGQDFLVTAAGPFVQLLLAGAFFAAFTFFRPPTVPAANFVKWVWVISFFWAILNLIPVIPLDGGRLVAILLGPNRQVLAHQVSIAIAIVFAVLLFIYLKSILFPIFLVAMAHQNWEAIKLLRR
ncbi:Zn-dependent protease [Haloferula luteola]|uniref:Zn-dependent protease n=1 Tax=Haloferula luteola TaxID=595692 RepID=A0A840VC08_9BACT|nr:site-2 protease family protein [Haloferula luteola]MBB5353084.1 Zn-dependent protease [Haloferula luteola]